MGRRFCTQRYHSQSIFKPPDEAAVREAWKPRAESWRLERCWPRVVARRGREGLGSLPRGGPGAAWPGEARTAPLAAHKRPLLGRFYFQTQSGMPACSGLPLAQLLLLLPTAQPTGAALPFACLAVTRGRVATALQRVGGEGWGSVPSLPSPASPAAACLPQPSADLQSRHF